MEHKGKHASLEFLLRINQKIFLTRPILIFASDDRYEDVGPPSASWHNVSLAREVLRSHGGVACEGAKFAYVHQSNHSNG